MSYFYLISYSKFFLNTIFFLFGKCIASKKPKQQLSLHRLFESEFFNVNSLGFLVHQTNFIEQPEEQR